MVLFFLLGISLIYAIYYGLFTIKVDKLKSKLDIPLHTTKIKLLNYMFGPNTVKKFAYVVLLYGFSTFMLNILSYWLLRDINEYPFEIALLVNILITLFVLAILLHKIKIEFYKEGIFINSIYPWSSFKGYKIKEDFIKIYFGEGYLGLINSAIYIPKTNRNEEIITHYLNEIVD